MSSLVYYALNPTDQSALSASATSVGGLISFMLVLLQAQTVLYGLYYWPEDYARRWWPLKQYFGQKNILGLIIPYPLLFVPENACWDTYHAKFQLSFPTSLTFDYIVVGSGAGGAAVASRLSEDSSRKVALVEAGNVQSSQSIPPQMFIFAMNNSQTFRVKANISPNHSNAFKNGLPLPCGKMLGGSTGINAMQWNCGARDDYDKIPNANWNYSNILPYIKKAERNTDPLQDPNYHGFGGKIYVSTWGSNRNSTDSYNAIVRNAFTELNYANPPDFNSGTYNGIFDIQASFVYGERCSSARGYLQHDYIWINSTHYYRQQRSNLVVLYNSTVDKVTFSGTTATGVIITNNANSTCPVITLRANREVIIAAGALHSPLLLMRSGIGKQTDLAARGITTIKNLPGVGDNLHDHGFGIAFVAVNPNATAQSTADVLAAALDYLQYRNGSLSHLGVLQVQGFINLTSTTAQYPDAQYEFYRFAKNQQYLNEILVNLGYKDNYIAKLLEVNQNYEIVMCWVTVSRPLSRGTVKMNSNDPYSLPNVTMNYYSDAASYDINTAVRGMQKLKNIMDTQSFQANYAQIIDFNLTACNSSPFWSDDYIKCYLKDFSASNWHFTSTTKMGLATDTSSVVDYNLKVHGINKLRVCDAGVLPNVPTGNTQCPTYAVGEKCADLIKAANP